MSHPDTLLIFDYSGTLSLEAPRFGRPENLGHVLADSGLAPLGVSTPDIFWEKVVNPTWVEGSTTQAGYRRVMAKQIAMLQRAPGASPDEVATAAARFVESYLGHSRIETDWRPLLTRLSENPNVGVIIATDHYAEATEMIIVALGAWGIPAVKIGTTLSCSSAGTSGALPRRCPFYIANSADLGSWKVAVAFWEAVKANLGRDKVGRLIVVEDFGFNEAEGDGYGGDVAKIARRREQTRATLQEVFGVEPEIIPFFLEQKQTGQEAEGARLIAETALRIESFLERQ